MKSYGTIQQTSKKSTSTFFQKESSQSFFRKSNPLSENIGIQTKLNINQPNDKYEQEADAMADKVVQKKANPGYHSVNDENNTTPFFVNTISSIQRKCSECEKEEKVQKKNEEENESQGVQRKPIFESNQEDPVQKKESNNNQNSSSSSIENQLSSSKGKGSPLSDNINNSMSESFGEDFSHVRVHTDSTAAHMNKELNAQAFTHGSDIYFNEGNYNTDNNAGKHLFAHELTHVVQQTKSNEDVINRSVNDNSTCDNTVDTNAPPSPLIFIILADAEAHMHLTMAKLTLSLDLMNTSGIPAGRGFDAYRRRFGDPTAVRNKFRNRFNSSLHNTLQEAQAAEMTSLISILDRLSNVLERDINYRCIGPHVRTIGGTSFDCATTGFALISTNGVNRIIICPAFWNLGAGRKGIGIIHEAVHILFPFGDHDTTPAQSSNQRRTEPECYASLVADINNVQPFDPSCPPV